MLQSSPERNRRVFIQSLVALGLVALLAWLRISVFELSVITSGSMEPTLRKGDYMLVNHRGVGTRQPARGEIVLFQTPKDWADDGKGDILVKRVIGLGGERIEFFQGRVVINGVTLNEDYLKDVEMPDDSRPFQLGPDQLYVLGDNRDNSDDSRTNGPISTSDLRAYGVARVYPFPRLSILIDPAYPTIPNNLRRFRRLQGNGLNALITGFPSKFLGSGTSSSQSAVAVVS